jgi:CHRD domain
MVMRHSGGPLVAILLASLILVTSAATVTAQTTLSTSLSGDEEVPGPGDKNGKGWVTLTIEPDGTVCYEGKVQAIGRELTGAHIHVGAVGVAGDVVVDLDPFGADITGNKAAHCVTTTPTTAAAIIANPSGYYVNVHTTDYPGGAIRGQLGD